MVRLVLLTLTSFTFAVSAHFLWLKEGGAGEALVTFDEKAGVPGPAFFLPMVADGISLLWTQNLTDSKSLNLTTRNVSSGCAELVSAFDANPPFRLQLASIFGIFNEDPAKPVSLLKYTSSADVVTEQGDWWDLQDLGFQSGLEITIRDPYASQPVVQKRSEGNRYPGDQCEPGNKFEDGDACVLAVVRFNGELLKADMNITTFSSNGSMLSTTFQPADAFGMVILKVPLVASGPHTEVFAKVQFVEATTGEFQGQTYQVVDHWATTYARIVRQSSDLLLL